MTLGLAMIHAFVEVGRLAHRHGAAHGTGSDQDSKPALRQVGLAGRSGWSHRCCPSGSPLLAENMVSKAGTVGRAFVMLAHLMRIVSGARVRVRVARRALGLAQTARRAPRSTSGSALGGVSGPFA
jgi:hypothetical protein